MPNDVVDVRPSGAWTLRKAVNALAVAPHSESLTRVGRMAFNVMIYLSQQNAADREGWWSAPISQIVHGFGSTTRDSSRVIDYIDRMARTSVKWFPLSPSDVPLNGVLVPGAQSSIEGVESKRASHDDIDGARVFTLLAEARFFRRSGEAWVQWYFAPSIREMLIEPVRWAQIDLQELASLSRYASVVLYEISSRYKNAPGGLTNRASTDWWANALRTDPKETTREWRKFKNETLKPALAEINQRTSLEVKLVEFKQGRAVTEIQFQVRKKQILPTPEPANLQLVDKAESMGIKERDLDSLVDLYGEAKVQRGIDALEGRTRVQLKERVAQPLNYLKRILKNDLDTESLFNESEGGNSAPDSRNATSKLAQADDSAAQLLRIKEINDALDALSPDEIEALATRARALMGDKVAMAPAIKKRFDAKQYRSPAIRHYIRVAYLEAQALATTDTDG